MRGLAFRLTSGEQFVPSAVELGPVPQNNLPQRASSHLRPNDWRADVRRGGREHTANR